MASVILTIARREVQDFLRDGRFRLSAVCLGVLLVAALAAGAARMQRERVQVADARQSVRDRWEQQGVDNPHNAAHYGTYAFKAPTSLSLADPGIDPFVGTTVFLEAHHQNTGIGASATQATDLLVFSELSGASILRAFVPLLIIMLAYGSIATDRESGMLRQLASTGVRTNTWVAGKIVGVAIALGVLVMPACVAGGILAVAFAPGAMGPRTATTAFMAALAYLAYYAIVAAVVLSISARSRTAHRALMMSLLVWCCTTLLIPRTIAAVAEAVYPQMTLAEFSQTTEEERRNGFSGHDPQDKRIDSVRAKTLAEYNVTRVEDLPISFAGVSLVVAEDHAVAVYDVHFGELWGRFRQQQQFVMLAGVIAPALAIDGLSSGLAETDLNAYARFTGAAEQYRRAFVQQLNREIVLRGKGLDYALMRDNAFWQSIPDMPYRITPLGTLLREQSASIATLAGWLIVSTVLLILGTRKVRVD